MATAEEIEARKRGERVVVGAPAPPPQQYAQQPVYPPYPPSAQPQGYYRYVQTKPKSPKEKLTSGFKEIKETVTAIKGLKDDIGEMDDLLNPQPSITQQVLESDWVGGVVGEVAKGLMDHFTKGANMDKELAIYEYKIALRDGLVEPRIHPQFMKGGNIPAQGKGGQGLLGNRTVPTKQPQNPSQKGDKTINPPDEALLGMTDEDVKLYVTGFPVDPAQVDELTKKLISNREVIKQRQAGGYEQPQEIPSQPPVAPQQPPVQQPQQAPNQDAVLDALQGMQKNMETQNKEFKEEMQRMGEKMEELEGRVEEEPKTEIHPNVLEAIRNKIAEKIRKTTGINKIPINQTNLMKLNKEELLEITRIVGGNAKDDWINRDIVNEVLIKIGGSK